MKKGSINKLEAAKKLEALINGLESLIVDHANWDNGLLSIYLTKALYRLYMAKTCLLRDLYDSFELDMQQAVIHVSESLEYYSDATGNGQEEIEKFFFDAVYPIIEFKNETMDSINKSVKI